MGQHHHPDDFHDEDLGRYNDEDENLEELGTAVYQGTGLSVRALTAEQLQRFLDAHQGQPAELLGNGWSGLNPPAATPPLVPAEVTGSLGSPGRSALAAYRRRRATELAAWTRSLVWRAPLVAAAALLGRASTAGPACRGRDWLGWRLLRWWPGGCAFGPPSRSRRGGAAPKGSGAPPACWIGSRATGTWCSTIWPCPAHRPTSITW